MDRYQHWQMSFYMQAVRNGSCRVYFRTFRAIIALGPIGRARTFSNIKLSELSIFIATPEQELESRRRSAGKWAMGLSLEDYLARDAFMDKQVVALDGRLCTWVLAPRDDPTSPNFVCSCKTYRRDGLVWYPPSPANPERHPRRVVCYGIASLFTPPLFRGKGYGTHVMRLLHWVLANDSFLPKNFPEKWGAPPLRVSQAGDGKFSALWSDVGRKIYEGCGPTNEEIGWIVREPNSTIWDVPHESESVDFDSWSWLDEDGVSKLWEKDADTIEHGLAPDPSTKYSFAFLPNRGLAAFQLWRMAPYLDKSLKTRHLGVWSKTIPDTFATWTFEVRPPNPKTLFVTRLSCRPENFRSLFSALTEAARKHDMEKLEICNLPRDLHPEASAVGGITFERDAHLSSFKWYGPENPRDITWLLNEGYCWC